MSAGLDALGQRGTAERRIAERRAIIHAHLEIAIGAVRERLESGWLGQEHSPLGRDRHMEAVRRRLAAGRPDAARAGRRYLLTIDAMVDEFFGACEPKLDRVVDALGRTAPANDNGRSP